MPDAMGPSPISNLTAKQLEALDYVGAGYMSKEAARILGISHKSFDRRIEVAKNKLGASTRAEAARIVKQVRSGVEFNHTPPTPIALATVNDAAATCRREDKLSENDGSALAAEPEGTRDFVMSVSEIRPEQLNAITRLGLMLLAAVLIMAVLLLGLGIVEGLQALR